MRRVSAVAALLCLLGALLGFGPGTSTRAAFAQEAEDGEGPQMATTTSDAEVEVSSWVVWLDARDGVVVQQDLQVDNSGDEAWLGHELRGSEERAVMALPMQPGAMDLDTSGRFTQCCATVVGNEYVHTTPLPPGRSTGTIRYRVAELEHLELVSRLPVASLSINVPEGVTVHSDDVEVTGQTSSLGNVYTRHTATALAAGEPVEVRFEGLTIALVRPADLAFAALAALAVAAVAALAAHWLQRRRGPVDPPTQAEGFDDTSARFEAVVEELALLDEAHELGWISSEDHDTLRVARAAEGRGEPDEGAASPSAKQLVAELALLDEGRHRGLLTADSHRLLRTRRQAQLTAFEQPTRG